MLDATDVLIRQLGNPGVRSFAYDNKNGLHAAKLQKYFVFLQGGTL
jgi:hypothetical protein